MQLYDIAVFVHVLGVIALFGGFIIHHRAGARLRAASTVEEASPWFALIDATKEMFPGGLLMLLVSGIYMTYVRWRSMPPFIVVGLVAWVVIMICGAVFAARQSRSIKAALAGTSGSLTESQRVVIHDRMPWLVVAVLNGMALGLVFLMSTKPSLLVSLVSLVVPALAGVFVGASVLKRP